MAPRFSSSSRRLTAAASRMFKPTPNNCQRHSAFLRSYATQTSGPSILSQTLDQKRRLPPNNDTVGPFQLGLAGQQSGAYAKPKAWSELSTSGKVLRTGARTTNLTVILIGAGLSALLIYSLTSELFSKNSPTVLHDEACERIKNSPKIAKLLGSPLSFHNNPPLLHRPRHHNHQVASRIVVEPSGREHMLLHFYVQGRPAGATADEESYFAQALSKAQSSMESASNLSWDEFVSVSQNYASEQAGKLRNVFRYVSGGASVTEESIPAPSAASQTTKEESQSGGGFFGLFSSIRGSKSSSDLTDSSNALAERTETEGEVHADLIRNDEGYFVFRYLLVDIPNSQTRSSKRVFLEKGPGVRENEPVMRWHSS